MLLITTITTSTTTIDMHKFYVMLHIIMYIFPLELTNYDIVIINNSTNKYP